MACWLSVGVSAWDGRGDVDADGRADGDVDGRGDLGRGNPYLCRWKGEA
jgi:hypothetical protein